MFYFSIKQYLSFFIDYFVIQQLNQLQVMLLLPKMLARSIKIITANAKPSYFKKNLFLFAETSREIQQKMSIERNKALQNKFKALDSTFGLKKPHQISQEYAKPSTIEYTIESLRKYSHLYPQYLLKQLNNKKSQFYQVIQTAIDGLSAVQNKQSIEFLEFMVQWKLYLHNQEYQQILVRKIYQMQLDLNELFRILKMLVKIQKQDTKNKIMRDLQNKILSHIIQINQYQYESLFKILNLMRIYDLSPKITVQNLQKLKKNNLSKQQGQQNASQITQDSFFKVIQKLLLRNLDEIPIPNLVEMIIHYSNNIQQQQDQKIMILGKVEAKVLESLPFFNHDELIAIMYSYVKTNTCSQTLMNQFVNRIQLLYFQISWQNKRKILNLSASFPLNKWMHVVGLSIFQILKGKKVIYHDGKIEVDPKTKQVEYQLLPSIYLSAYETNLATAELIDKLQSRILQDIFNYPAEDVGLIAWLFTITPSSLKPKNDNKDMLHTKLQAIIEGGFNGSTFTLKNISMVVWSLCNTGGKSNSIYKQNADFWKNIQSYIQQRIGNHKQQRLFNGCCQILWAYANNKPLSIKTINMIIDHIVSKQTSNQLSVQMFNFQLTTVTSFFYSLRPSLPKSINQFFEKISIKYFGQLISEMDYHQIMKMLKYIIYDDNEKLQQSKLSKQLWQKVLDNFVLYSDRIQYSSIMGVVGFTIISPQGQKTQPKAVEIVKKLMARKKNMEQLRTTPPQQSK